MKYTKVPFYYYLDGTQVQSGNIVFIQDTAFVERWTSFTEETVLQDWQDLTDTDPASRVNNYLNFNLVNSYTPFYVGLASGETLSADWWGYFSNFFNIDYHLVTNWSWSNSVTTSAKLINNCTWTSPKIGRVSYYQPPATPAPYMVTFACPLYNVYGYYDNRYSNYDIYFMVFREDFFEANGSITTDETKRHAVQFRIEGNLNSDKTSVNRVKLSVKYWNPELSALLNNWSPAFTLANAQSTTNDGENPFPDNEDDPPGGDGPGGDPNNIDPTDIPDLPDISTTDFVTIYNPSTSDLNSLAAFLWSDRWSLDSFKKVTENPMDTIISLSVLPCVPATMGTKHIKLGNIDTEITSNYCTKQWAKVDCGSVSIKKVVGSFMDYTPYVKISLFLPYCGFVHLDTDDIMGGSINVVYHVECVSGDLVCFIKHSKRGVLYAYNGNCRCSVPVTQANYGSFWNNYYQQVSGIIPATVSGAASGGAAGAALGAFSSTYNAAVDVSLNNKPTYQRSGSVAGAAGIMGVQKPFIIIERPNISVPKNVGHYAGQMCNKTLSLGSCSGMTIVEAVHLDGISQATSDELREIEELLKNGVIL